MNEENVKRWKVGIDEEVSPEMMLPQPECTFNIQVAYDIVVRHVRRFMGANEATLGDGLRNEIVAALVVLDFVRNNKKPIPRPKEPGMRYRT